MKNILEFLKTTLIGGVLFLVPVVVLAVVAAKALTVTEKIVAPLATRLPFESLIGLQTPVLPAVAVLVVLCFGAGLLAKARFAKRTVGWLESALVSKVPGYKFLKGMAESMAGIEEQKTHETVLARFDDMWQIAFLIEHVEGGHVVLFVPGAPTPWSGSVYFMTEDRIQPLNIPRAAVLKCLSGFGVGAKRIWPGLRPPLGQ